MEQLLDCELEVTQYFVWREHEWGCYMSVAKREGDGVVLDVELLNREMPVLATLRSFPLTMKEDVSLPMKRLNGTEDHVGVFLKAIDGSRAVLRLELPEGVQSELVKDDDEPEAS